MHEISLENILQDRANQKSTVKKNGTLLVKWHFKYSLFVISNAWMYFHNALMH